MKSLEILVSTMNQNNSQELIKKMNIKEKCVIINQIPDTNIKLPNKELKDRVKFLSYNEKGLSKSRNKAIINSSQDICVLADDDMYYVENAREKILNAYKKYKNADIIAFDVDNEDNIKRKKILKEGRVNFLKSMKISSVQITFKRKSIIENKIIFDEEFGSGSKYPWGEENIFLYDCLRKKLNIYYLPIKIATLRATTTSTWDKTNSERHYEQQGAIYYRMSKRIYLLLILQFAIRKRKIYRKDLDTKTVLKSMFIGAKIYKKSFK